MSAATLTPVALVVSPDEPCFQLVELNLQRPGSRGWRRYQVLRVVRADRLAQAWEDMGPAKAFSAPQFRILGGVVDEATSRIEILHTVGELKDIAEAQRTGIIAQPELPPPTNLIRLYQDELDKRRKRRRKTSTFGAMTRLQRG